MSLAYTTEQILKKVRDQYQIGDAGSLGTTDADLLDFINSEMLMEIIPQIARLHEEFFVITELIDLPISGGIEVTHIKIPDRAVGNSLRDLFLIRGGDRISLPRINREDLGAFETDRGGGSGVRGFFIEGARIRVFPGGQAADKLEVAYLFRPSQLVKADGYRTVTALDKTLNTVTVSGGTPPPFVVGDLIDIHGPNSGAEIRVFDNQVTTVAGNILTLADPIDGTDVREGRQVVELEDFVAQRETAAIPMLPRELHPILAQAAVVRLAEAMDDQEKMAMHQRQLERQMKLSRYFLEKRVIGRPRKIVNRNSPLWRQGNIQRRSI